MQSAALYTDFGAIADLRFRAASEAEGAAEETAAQFESLFVQMMLKAMREATIDGGLFSSHQLETYEQMYDQQIAVELSANGGLGLGEILAAQLQADTAAATGHRDSDAARPFELPTGDSGLRSLTLGAYRERPLPSLPVRDISRSGSAAAQSSAAEDRREPGAPAAPGRSGDSAAQPAVPAQDMPALATAGDFVAWLRPLARPAAQALGVHADVLVAQSALETGWGRRVIATEKGSSFNLFNIKAGANWAGPSVAVPTLEYRDGVAVRESARFRVYDSPAESFLDYVKLISGSERYRGAVEAAEDAPRYLGELQRAGYATDPAYARKILDILDRSDLAALSSD